MTLWGERGMKNKTHTKNNFCTAKPFEKNRAIGAMVTEIVQVLANIDHFLVLDREKNIFAQAIVQPKNHAHPKAPPPPHSSHRPFPHQSSVFVGIFGQKRDFLQSKNIMALPPANITVAPSNPIHWSVFGFYLKCQKESRYWADIARM